MARERDYEKEVLAQRVALLMRAVAGDSPTKLARLLNDVPQDATASRTDERARDVESDRRLISRWLSGEALMERSSRLKLLEVANQELARRGEKLLPDDFLTVDQPDPLEEINSKLDLLLAHFGLSWEPGVQAAVVATQRLEQVDAEQSRPAGRRTRGGAR